MIREIRFVSKFMTPQPGTHTVEIHVLPSISKSKGNQSMKFAQLIKFYMRNIFLLKAYTQCGGETIPRLYS